MKKIRACIGTYDEDNGLCFECPVILKTGCLYATIKELNEECDDWVEDYQRSQMELRKLQGEQSSKPYIPDV